MGSMFRSQEMLFCQMYIQGDAAYTAISLLGELGIVQFKDLNAGVNSFQRHYVSEIRRCEEMERQLRFFERELKRAAIEPVELRAIPDAPAERSMIDLEALFESSESELREVNNNLESLEKNYTELCELDCVLRQTDVFFKQTQLSDLEVPGLPSALEGNLDIEEARTSNPNLRYITGVIPTAKVFGFNRSLWLVSRGTIFLRHVEISEPIRDPVTGDDVYKSVFVAICHGDALLVKLKKIAEGYRAALYPCPQSADERKKMLVEVGTRLNDLRVVLEKSKEQRDRSLHNISLQYLTWNIKVLKLKACFHTLNLLQREGLNYVAECWLPYSELSMVQTVLDRSTELCGTQAPSILHPIQPDFLPTFHKVNKFTTAFQTIINSYGVATYREANPALFSIITFPFLFSIMFGDAGHGLLMLIFALFLVIFEVKLKPYVQKNEIYSIIFGGRYIILLMGLFSIYSGLMYNDVFSKSLNIFGSQWHTVYDDKTIQSQKEFMLDPNNASVYGRTPYFFGVDPVWNFAGNKITFTNSFKKKLSIIFGVCQMLLGIFLGLTNHLYFRHYLNIITEFIPMLLFLLSTFGYLCGLVIAKWALFPHDASFYQCSPNILIGFINMFMLKYDNSLSNHCSNHTWFPGQKELQIFLVVLAVVCAIWLLLAKPLVLYIRHRNSHSSERLIEEDAEQVHTPTEDGHGQNSDRHPLYDNGKLDEHPSGHNSSEAPPSPAVTVGPRFYHYLTKPVEHEEAFEFGDVFIHQVIHTIEFCLGCVSHTASYLRLWALSLAHAQLSEVLWSMVLHPAFSMQINNVVKILMTFVVFTPFAVLTVVILMVMEGLSAFLHTLRLHWVEFNSKFYQGEGRAFEPFSFAEIMQRQNEY